jgi:hypothetical protein
MGVRVAAGVLLGCFHPAPVRFDGRTFRPQL